MKSFIPTTHCTTTRPKPGTTRSASRSWTFSWSSVTTKSFSSQSIKRFAAKRIQCGWVFLSLYNVTSKKWRTRRRCKMPRAMECVLQSPNSRSRPSNSWRRLLWTAQKLKRDWKLSNTWSLWRWKNAAQRNYSEMKISKNRLEEGIWGVDRAFNLWRSFHHHNSLDIRRT